MSYLPDEVMAQFDGRSSEYADLIRDLVFTAPVISDRHGLLKPYTERATGFECMMHAVVCKDHATAVMQLARIVDHVVTNLANHMEHVK